MFIKTETPTSITNIPELTKLCVIFQKLLLDYWITSDDLEKNVAENLLRVEIYFVSDTI